MQGGRPAGLLDGLFVRGRGVTASSLAQRVLAGELRSAGQLMRDLDDGLPGAIDAYRLVYPHTGRAAVIGVTGNPGVGKSTLVSELVGCFRQRGHRVGVVAVDPSSPVTGGALLGDRIRMQRHALDPDVFIRSLATRGQMGGLSRSTADVVGIMDAAGFDPIIVETVGVGQDEVDVVGLTDTAVVITVPGLGDEVQALKAGLFEVADVLVVNKADREGADRTVADLTTMLALRAAGASDTQIVKTAATRGEGLDSLLAALEDHAARQKLSGRWAQRRLARAAGEVRDIVLWRARQAALAALALDGGEGAADVAARRSDPYTVAAALRSASDAFVSPGRDV